MKLLIDNIDSITGWTAGNGASVTGVCEIEGYSAGNNSASGQFQFSGIGSYVEKDYANIDVSDYNEFVIHAFSTDKGNDSYNKPGDFLYKIDFGPGKEVYMPVYPTFTDITIDISDIDTLERIRITALSEGTDTLILSYAVVVFDEIPLDIFTGLKEQIEYTMSPYLNKFHIGLVSGTTGDESITYADNVPYIDRYAALRIDDGVNSEIHKIKTRDNLTITFEGIFDGKSLLNDYIDANSYVYIPVQYGRQSETQIILPSITIWGIEPIEDGITTNIEKRIVSFNIDGTFKEEKAKQFHRYDMIVDAESRTDEILVFMSNMINDTANRFIIWVNGRKVNITIDSKPTEVKPTIAYEVIPKIQYIITAQIKEDVWLKKVVSKTTTINFQAEPVSQ